MKCSKRPARLVNSRARAKNIRIVRDLDQEIPYFGDEAFLHQLFLIFLDNAIKYSPSGTSVRVTLENRDGEVRAGFRGSRRGNLERALTIHL